MLRRTIRMSLGCLLLWHAVGSYAYPLTFIVFPPESRTRGSALAWVGEGLAISISEQLQIPGVAAVDYEDRFSLVEGSDLPPNSPLSRASMIRVTQHAGAERLVFGSYAGNAEKLQVELQVLDMKSMKLGPKIVTTGPIATLPEMENELAWQILRQAALNKNSSREKYREKTRSIANAAYSSYIGSLRLSDREAQVKLLLKAVELHPDFPEAQFRLGRHHYEKEDWPSAIKHLEKARAESHSYLQTQFMLGNSYYRQGEFSHAIRAYSAILPFVQSAEVLNNLGVTRLREGDYALAVQDLIQARNLARTDPVVAMNLALLRHLQGNEPAALSVVDEALRSNPSHEMLNYLQGFVLAAQGHAERSALALSKAARLGLDVRKLKNEDPRSWAQIYTKWGRQP